MDAVLDQLLGTGTQALEALTGPLAASVDEALRLTPNPDSASQSGALRSKIHQVITTLHKIEQIITPPQVQFMDAIFAATNTKVLVTAVTYRFADLLAAAPSGALSVEKLAEAAGVQQQACRQVVRYLADTMGQFTYNAETDTVANNRVSELLRTDHWTTWHSWIDLYAGEHYDILPRLPEAIAVGEPRNAAQLFYDTDENVYAVMERKGMTAAFHKAIGAFTIAEGPGFLADYHWAEVSGEVVTDVGAGGGDFVWNYLNAFPEAKAAAFELPGTAELIRKRFDGPDAAALKERLVEVRGGDMYVDELPKSAVYFLKFVLHNWDDEHCIALLKRLRESIVDKPGVSRVLVGEHVVVDGRLGDFARYADIRMLLRARNKERTLEEYQILAEKGGFRIHEMIAPRGCLTKLLDLRPIN